MNPRHARGFVWTLEEVGVLAILAKDGFSGRQIGNIANRSRSAVIAKSERLGIQLNGKRGARQKTS